MDDPISNTFIRKATELNLKVTREIYTRSWETNEDLGLPQDDIEQPAKNTVRNSRYIYYPLSLLIYIIYI